LRGGPLAGRAADRPPAGAPEAGPSGAPAVLAAEGEAGARYVTVYY
jgi:hypothetical protein